ncbi:uncharacterized protein LOC125241257 [Leguminivora glycinivorella]|uniref:uncharacterized protein LOC125241257 n=1 Tax=Leguminivora glycinivorella TaxID=1035111 RepID=UPI00200DE985|nr:uncharacterized protein LOC125241257 [Leguminivora glycinivorella]
MNTISALSIMVLSGLVAASPRGPCGCQPVFEYCANDYTTYHSICEFKCKHPSVQFNDWYILYEGPCVSELDTTTQRTTTTRWRTKTTMWQKDETASNSENG